MKPLWTRRAELRGAVHWNRAIEDAAADWLIRRNAGFSGPEESEFRQWLSADPRHRGAFTDLEETWAALNHPRQAGRAEVALDALRQRGRRRARRRACALGAVGLTGAIAGLLILLAPGKNPQTASPLRPQATTHPVPVTVVVHPDTRHLPDGSVVELNAGAEVAWDFSGARRMVRLAGGEALFTVAKDADHPFVVVVNGVEVRAIGTVFDVCRRRDGVDVLVTEGKVNVDLPAPKARTESDRPPNANLPIAVSAGERATIPFATDAQSPVVTPASAVEIRRLLAWHSKRIEFTGTPLFEVVDLFNQENSLQLTIGDASVRDLQITGVYWTDDPEGFLRLLQSGLDLKIERDDGHVVLRAP